MDERRYNRRYNVFITPLKCTEAESGAEVKILDISRDGISILLKERVFKGHEVHLEITLPEDDIPLFIKGEVAWVIKASEGDNTEYSAGIKIVDLNKCDTDRLIHYIHTNHHHSSRED